MTSADEDVQLVADFVRRLRRVALHPLALDPGLDGLPGGLLRWLIQVPTEVEEHDDGTATIRGPLPDEVQFESLATRVRIFTLTGDRLHWKKAFDALDRLTGFSTDDLRAEWTRATDRARPGRAFFTGYQVGDEPGGETQHLTDVELAYAWLYQDVAHGDEVSTGFFDVTERYKAAVGVFAHMAVVTIETLEYINQLTELAVINLPVGTFTDPVVVTANYYEFHGFAIETDVGDDLSDPALIAALTESMPETLRPALGLAQRLVQGRTADPSESETVSMEVIRRNREEG